MIRHIFALAVALPFMCAEPVAVPAQVTINQAKAAAASASTYLTGTPAWSCDPAQSDGWNPVWYAHARPDVVAAKLDLRYHYVTYGKREGTPPCQPATVTIDQARASVATLTSYVAQPVVAASAVAAPSTPTSRDMTAYPAPTVRMTDLWLPAGASVARVQVFLERNGQPVERSYGALLIAQNASDTGGLRFGQYLAQQQQVAFFPSTGSRAEWAIPLAPGATGHFPVYLLRSVDGPEIKASMTVHVGETPPAGVAIATPAALPVLTPTALVMPAGAPAYDDDLHDLTGWRIGGFSLNTMKGYFPAPGDVTVSGKHPDVMPYMTEAGRSFRRFRPIDTRADLLYIAATGQYFRSAMPAITRNIGGATGTWLVRGRLPGWVAGTDPSMSWGTRQDGGWPPELDTVERFSWQPGYDITTFHATAANLTQGFGVPGAPTDWHVRVYQRTPTDATHLAMYRQWICAYDMSGCRLTVEAPDYVAGEAIGTNLTIEGWGGAAAGGDEPASPYVAEALGAYMDIDRVAYWPLG